MAVVQDSNLISFSSTQCTTFQTVFYMKLYCYYIMTYRKNQEKTEKIPFRCRKVYYAFRTAMAEALSETPNTAVPATTVSAPAEKTSAAFPA